MDQMIPLFAIASLDHERYTGMKRRYLAGGPALVNCDLLGISRLLSIEEIRQKSLGLPSPTPPFTSNHVSDAPVPYPPTGQPQPHPNPSTNTSSTV